MKIEKIFFTFCLICILTGCLSVEGTYIVTYYGGGQGRLCINKDYSFIFYPPPLGVGEGGLYETTGTWKRKKNHLVLNSDFQDTAQIHIEEIFCPNVSMDSILFRIYDMVTGEPLWRFSIYNSHSFFDMGWTDKKGELMLPKIKDMNKVYLNIRNVYNLTNENTNVLNVYYRRFIYWDFIDMVYKIEKDRLIEVGDEYIEWRGELIRAGDEFIKIKEADF